VSEPPIEIVSSGRMSGRLVPVTDYSPARADVASASAEPALPHETPWCAGVFTGIGSLPGTDPDEAAALVAGELPDLPHLVELPNRGVGADMLGRALAICVDLPAEVVPSGWRLARRTGRDMRRANDFLAWDLDAAEQHYAGAPRVKVQVAGPWTLAANVETPRGHRALTDDGAVRDLAASLAEGLAAHLADLARRLPGTRFVVQIDEPSLPAVLVGSLSTASGFGSVPAIPAAEAEQVLAELVGSLGDRPTVAHCCHRDIPLNLLRRAGFGAVSLDLTRGSALPPAALDAIGEAVEAGTVLLAGIVPTASPGGSDAPSPDTSSYSMAPPGEGTMPESMAPQEESGRGASGPLSYRDIAAPLLDIWHRLGLPDASLERVAVTPVCGLASATPSWTRRALRLSRDAARLLADRAHG